MLQSQSKKLKKIRCNKTRRFKSPVRIIHNSSSDSESDDKDTIPTSYTKVERWFAKNEQEQKGLSLISSSSDELISLDESVSTSSRKARELYSEPSSSRRKYDGGHRLRQRKRHDSSCSVSTSSGKARELYSKPSSSRRKYDGGHRLWKRKRHDSSCSDSTSSRKARELYSEPSSSRRKYDGGHRLWKRKRHDSSCSVSTLSGKARELYSKPSSSRRKYDDGHRLWKRRFDDSSSSTTSSENGRRSRHKEEYKRKYKVKSTWSNNFNDSENLRKKTYKRKWRPCHICSRWYKNVGYHHRKYHPGVDKTEFMYGNKAKVLGVGKYKNFKGFECPWCKRVLLNLDKHAERVHKDKDAYSPEFVNAKKHLAVGGKSLHHCIQQYQQYLSETGVGKRQQTSPSVAKSYGNQVRTLIPDIETLKNPLQVYNNLKGKITGEGQDSTRYAYIATLLNFIKFYKVHEYRLVDPRKIELLYMEAKDWEARQKKIKKKREFIVKEKSRKKISGIQNAYEAILIYENSKECRRVRSLVNKSKVNKKDLELLYANLFCRIICKLGCRPSVFTGMTISELEQHEKTAENNYSILVKKQKDVQPACLVVNEIEFKDIKKISKVAWQYTKQDPSVESVVFPSLAKNGCSVSSAEFSRVFKLASKVVFNHTSLNATDIRKIIQTLVRDEPLNVQVAVAKASGHSVQVADQVYNVSHPHESVEKARKLLGQRAVDKVSAAKTYQHLEESEDLAVSDRPLSLIGKTINKTSKTSSHLVEKSEDITVTDRPLSLIGDTNNKSEFIRVRFEDDGEFLIVYRTKDVKLTDSRKGVRSFNEIKIGDKCKARWPGDRKFYVASRVDMKEGSFNLEGQSDSEIPKSPVNSPKKLRKLVCKNSILFGSHTP